MNLLDLALGVVLVVTVRGGLRSGLVARGAALVGTVAGVVLAARVLPLALRALPASGSGLRVFVGVFVVGITVSLVATLAGALAAPLRRLVAGGALGALDRGIGAVGSAAALVVLVWLVAPTAADVAGPVAREVRGSLVIGTIDALTPRPPDALRGLRVLLGGARFPEVFADLAPSPDTGPPPETLAVGAGALEAALAATVNVEVVGCGARYEGSGVTLAEATVVTNAHVVAGAERVEVRLPDGSVRVATVTVLDPVRDLAVLRVEDHPQRPLTLAEPRPGTDAVVIGHPGGQDVARVAPVRIDRRVDASGRDVYGTGPAERRLLLLAATLRPGDSGGPVIDVDGAVVGIVFAISPDDPTTAYALDVDEVRAVLDAPRRPGEVGPCLDGRAP